MREEKKRKRKDECPVTSGNFGLRFHAFAD